MLALSHIKLSGQDAAAQCVLAVVFLEPVVELLRGRKRAFNFRIVLLRTAENETERHHAAGNRAAQTLRASDSHRKSACHRDDIFRNIDIKIRTDRA